MGTGTGYGTDPVCDGVLRADIVKELAMTARIFDGQQAFDYGVVSHLKRHANGSCEEFGRRIK